MFLPGGEEKRGAADFAADISTWRRNARYDQVRVLPSHVGTRLAGLDEIYWSLHTFIVPLMWLSTQTRSDVSDAVTLVARYAALRVMCPCVVRECQTYESHPDSILEMYSVVPELAGKC